MDRQTFDRLMLEHLAAAQRFAVRLTGDVAQAEDVLHDAFIRAATRCDTFKGHSRFTTWLFAIIVNSWRDKAGMRRDESIVNEPHDMDALGPSRRMQSAEAGQLIAMKVSSLPARQREVLVLIAYENMTTTEVACMLGMSEQNVRVNLFHARQRLKTELAPLLDEELRESGRSTTQ